MRANNCLIVGRLAGDPKFHKSTGEKDASRLNCRVIVNRVKSDKYDVFPVTVWGPYAEVCADHLSKGKEVTISGEIRTNSEKQEDGTYKNFWNLNAQTVSFGRDSAAKNQQEKTGTSDGIDAIAAKLAAKVGKSSDPVDELTARLCNAHGFSKAEAKKHATEYLASQKSGDSAAPAATSDDPFSDS